MTHTIIYFLYQLFPLTKWTRGALFNSLHRPPPPDPPPPPPLLPQLMTRIPWQQALCGEDCTCCQVTVDARVKVALGRCASRKTPSGEQRARGRDAGSSVTATTTVGTRARLHGGITLSFTLSAPGACRCSGTVPLPLKKRTPSPSSSGSNPNLTTTPKPHEKDWWGSDRQMIRFERMRLCAGLFV